MFLKRVPRLLRRGISPRSRSVTAPNLGGYIGASVRYSNSKISLGYRADSFFDVMDGGQDTARASIAASRGLI